MQIASFTISCVVAIWAVVSSIIAFFQNKKIETIKTKLDSFSHMTKEQFDYEFQIYKEISRALGTMIESTSKLYPFGVYYESLEEEKLLQERTEKYHKSIDDYNIFQKMVSESQPFIDENIFDALIEIHKLCHDQICLYWDFMISKNDAMKEECTDEYKACWERTPVIFEKRTQFNVLLKNYLKKNKIMMENK